MHHGPPKGNAETRSGSKRELQDSRLPFRHPHPIVIERADQECRGGQRLSKTELTRKPVGGPRWTYQPITRTHSLSLSRYGTFHCFLDRAVVRYTGLAIAIATRAHPTDDETRRKYGPYRLEKVTLRVMTTDSADGTGQAKGICSRIRLPLVPLSQSMGPSLIS